MARSALLVLVGSVLLAASLSGQEQTGFPRLPAPPVKSPSDTTAPDIPGVVVGGTKVHLIRDLFQSTEGPIAMPDGSLLFTEQDAGDGRLVRIDANGVATCYRAAGGRTPSSASKARPAGLVSSAANPLAAVEALARCQSEYVVASSNCCGKGPTSAARLA